MAEIFVTCGEYDEAISEIDYILSLETDFTVNDFKTDPQLDPLREMPEFKALMEKYELPSGLDSAVTGNEPG